MVPTSGCYQQITASIFGVPSVQNFLRVFKGAKFYDISHEPFVLDVMSPKGKHGNHDSCLRPSAEI